MAYHWHPNFILMCMCESDLTDYMTIPPNNGSDTNI